jgi:hypothetical protein
MKNAGAVGRLLEKSHSLLFFLASDQKRNMGPAQKRSCPTNGLGRVDSQAPENKKENKSEIFFELL